MKSRFLSTMAVIGLALVLIGCLTTSPYSQTGLVSQADQVSIPPGQNAGKWQGRDLTVDYEYSRGEGAMDLSGTVIFADSMTLGYSLLRDFHLSAIFLDENGRVLQTQSLATGLGTLDPIPFRKKLTLTSSAVAMSFSYSGTAIESGGDDGGGGPTSFWYSPVQ